MPTFREDIRLGTKVPQMKTEDYEDSSVTTEKIANEAITESKLAEHAVTSSILGNGAVERINIQDGAVGTQEIEDGSITNEKLAENAITKDKLKDNTIGVEKLDPKLRDTISAATGLPENLVETIQNVDDTLRDHQSQLDDKQSQIDDKQQQITANDEDISLLQTRSTQIEETIKSIAATGGASQAIAVTYNNTNSQLKSINIQGAVDELQKSKIDKTSIVQETGDSEDKVMSQKAVSDKFSNLSKECLILAWNTDIATTRKTVTIDNRKTNLIISYTTDAGKSITEKYIGNSFTDTEWSKDDNWISISDSTTVVYTGKTSYSEKGKNYFFNKPAVGDVFSYKKAVRNADYNIVEIPVQSGTTLTNVYLKGLQGANSCIVCGLDLKVKKVIPYPITQDIVFDEEGIAFFNMHKSKDHFTIRNPEVISAIDNALSEIIPSVDEKVTALSQFNLSPNSLFGYKLYNKYFTTQEVGTIFSFKTSTTSYTKKDLDMFIMPVIPGVILSDVHLKGIGYANSYIVVDRDMKILKSVDYPITEDITFDVEGIAIFNMGYKDYFKITNSYTITMALTKWLIDINSQQSDKINEITSNIFNTTGFASFSKIIFIGDSVTEGDISDLGAATFGTIRKSLSYPAKVAQLYGVKTVNLGHSGISISDWLNKKYDEFTNNKEDADCCVIELGWNIPKYPSTEEEIDKQIQSDVAQYGDDYNSYNTASSIGCYCKLIKKIQNDAPNIIIFIVASFKFPHLYTYATQKIAAQTGVIFIDASSYSPDGYDNLHFTALGYAKKASIISYLIGSLPDAQKRIISSKLRILHAN